VEALLAIIDRLIALFQGYKESREALFRDHIEPLFLDLSYVHSDYVGAFDKICLVFLDPRTPIWEIAPKVDDMRRQLDHLRVKINALTDTLRTACTQDRTIPDEVCIFADAVANYFQVGAGHGSTLRPAKGSTYYTTLLDLIAMAETQAISKKECEKCAEVLFKSVRSKWSDVTVAYATAKMKCLR